MKPSLPVALPEHFGCKGLGMQRHSDQAKVFMPRIETAVFCLGILHRALWPRYSTQSAVANEVRHFQGVVQMWLPGCLTCTPLPVSGTKPSTEVVKRAPANFSSSDFLPCGRQGTLSAASTAVPLPSHRILHEQKSINCYEAVGRLNRLCLEACKGSCPLHRPSHCINVTAGACLPDLFGSRPQPLCGVCGACSFMGSTFLTGTARRSV